MKYFPHVSKDLVLLASLILIVPLSASYRNTGQLSVSVERTFSCFEIFLDFHMSDSFVAFSLAMAIFFDFLSAVAICCLRRPKELEIFHLLDLVASSKIFLLEAYTPVNTS